MEESWYKLLEEFKTPFTDPVLVFSVVLFIILLVPILFNRFKIPGIIGLIISGTIIGPHGLSLIQKNSAVDLFSTIGLLYIMFIAGLELDMNEFRKNKHKSLVFGILTFVIPITLGFPVCHYLLGYGFNTSLLTASMFATHTLVAYPIIARLGISKNQAVAIAVGGTILTDTAVLILLAVISGSEVAGGTNSLWVKLTGSILVFIFIVAFIIPRIASWFFRRLEDDKHAHFIFVLSIVFFLAFLAKLAGLEPIIGAFAAGLTLNRIIPHTSTLMNRIGFVGNALFIPFFLISVGMLVDVRVLVSGPKTILVAITLTLVALIAKWLAAQITGRLFSYTSAERSLIFGLSSAHAAATLAVILVGYNIGLVDDHLLNGTVILILMTCIVASFVTERSGKQIVMQTDTVPEMIIRQQRIIVPIANPATMEKLIDMAVMMKSVQDSSPITALTVVKDNDQSQQKLLESKNLLHKAIMHGASADQQIEIISTIDRNVTSGIKRIVKEKFISDIILGWSPETKFTDIIFGRTFDSVLRQTSQNIFITRLVVPLNVQRRLILICPQLAEKEGGFYKWLISVLRLASQLQLKIFVYATDAAFNAIEDYIKLNQFSLEVFHKGVVELNNIKPVVRLMDGYDTVMLVSSREGGISYSNELDVLPRKLAKLLPKNNLVFIYPETLTENAIPNYEQEVTGGMLEKGINFLKSAKGILKNN